MTVELDEQVRGYCDGPAHNGSVGPLPLYPTRGYAEYYDNESWVCDHCLRTLTPTRWHDNDGTLPS